MLKLSSEEASVTLRTAARQEGKEQSGRRTNGIAVEAVPDPLALVSYAFVRSLGSSVRAEVPHQTRTDAMAPVCLSSADILEQSRTARLTFMSSLPLQCRLT